MGKEMDNFDQLESLVSKRNRRKKLEPKTHKTEVGPLPPTGIHKEDPEISQRKLREIIKKDRKK